jgi:hypothetical protein
MDGSFLEENILSRCGMTLFLINKRTVSSSSFMSSAFVHGCNGAREHEDCGVAGIDNLQLAWVQKTFVVGVRVSEPNTKEGQYYPFQPNTRRNRLISKNQSGTIPS